MNRTYKKIKIPLHNEKAFDIKDIRNNMIKLRPNIFIL